jgi:predicted DsbA family dithiol-disulfide isomerase
MKHSSSPSFPVSVTYYTEVVSSWCFWVEPAWAQLKSRFANKVHFEWKSALMDGVGLPTSRAQCDWFYRRSGTIMRSPVMLNSGWFEPALEKYNIPNYVAEGAKNLGSIGDEVRLAIMRAALVDGAKVGRWEVALEIGARAGGLDPERLRMEAQSEATIQRAHETTREFYSFQVNQRPAFLVQNSIGDRAVFSGLVAIEPLAATIEAMIHDSAAYASYSAHHGSAPAA